MNPAAIAAGARFGRLAVISATDERKGGSLLWECRCDCGSTARVTSSHLRSGFVRSCGCLRREHCSQMRSPPRTPMDLSGERFTRLVAVSLCAGSPAKWRCRCDCGKETVVAACKLRGGSTASCGCLRREKSRSRAYVLLAGKRGPESPHWNAELGDADRQGRREPESQLWSREVLRRAGYHCIACGKRGGLHAHHLLSYRAHPELRFDLSNGVAACVTCHTAFHRHVGLRNTAFTRADFFTFFGLADPAERVAA